MPGARGGGSFGGGGQDRGGRGPSGGTDSGTPAGGSAASAAAGAAAGSRGGGAAASNQSSFPSRASIGGGYHGPEGAIAQGYHGVGADLPSKASIAMAALAKKTMLGRILGMLGANIEAKAPAFSTPSLPEGGDPGLPGGQDPFQLVTDLLAGGPQGVTTGGIRGIGGRPRLPSRGDEDLMSFLEQLATIRKTVYGENRGA